MLQGRRCGMRSRCKECTVLQGLTEQPHSQCHNDGYATAANPSPSALTQHSCSTLSNHRHTTSSEIAGIAAKQGEEASAPAYVRATQHLRHRFPFHRRKSRTDGHRAARTPRPLGNSPPPWPSFSPLLFAKSRHRPQQRDIEPVPLDKAKREG